MATIVGPLEGIKYGLKLLGYFLSVLIISSLVTGVGLGIAASGIPATTTGALAVFGPDVSTVGQQSMSPDVGRVVAGGAVSVIGVSLGFAGVMGALYKVIADGVYTGNARSRDSMLSE